MFFNWCQLNSTKINQVNLIFFLRLIYQYLNFDEIKKLEDEGLSTFLFDTPNKSLKLSLSPLASLVN